MFSDGLKLFKPVDIVVNQLKKQPLHHTRVKPEYDATVVKIEQVKYSFECIFRRSETFAKPPSAAHFCVVR
ncbi:hypothetical protein AKG43_03915 [Neisseria sp. 74A18]|nr:hypothetical protein AKG43_03915 [Neisseria sp. 74A18]